MSRREQVFSGWGEPGAGPSLPAHAEAFLRDRLGVPGGMVSPPVAFEDVRVRPPALPEGARRSLEAIVGSDHVRDDREARVLRCRGKSYLDLLAQRAGDCEDAPDAVVAPATHAEVAAVLRTCMEAGVAVVPFGGGTSVVGGVEPLRGPFDALVSLDLARLGRVEGIDERALTAVVEPGLRLPELERILGARGFTLGHFPQSFEWATVGGCVATRSAGQASTGFGRIDELVVGLRCATPAGELAGLEVPATAAGPDLREVVVGSEGALGVITRSALRIRPVAAARRYEGWFIGSFAEGADALRRLEQDGLAPDVARLSDETETEVSVALSGRDGLKASLGGLVLRARGLSRGCLLILGWEDAPEEIARRRGRAARMLRRAGAMPVGKGAGEAWLAGRYAGPHLRDDLLDRGVLVETLETAGRWSRLDALYQGVAGALRETLSARGTPPIVMCHVSHLYPTGGSLYFTAFARREEADPRGQWEEAKDAACRAVVAAGGTITHHHAVGRDHAPYLGAEVGGFGLEVLRAVKERCDPAGVMNPGKLLEGTT